EGAAVRDETGRTYAAAAVNLPTLRMSALRLAVAMAVSSGATVLEAAALVSDADAPDPGDLAVVRDVGPGAVACPAGADGAIGAPLRPCPAGRVPVSVQICRWPATTRRAASGRTTWRSPSRRRGAAHGRTRSWRPRWPTIRSCLPSSPPCRR